MCNHAEDGRKREESTDNSQSSPSVGNDTTSARDRTRSRGGLAFEHDVTGSGDRRRITIHRSVDPADSGRITSEPTDVDALSYDEKPAVADLPASGDRLDSCGDAFHGLFCPDCLETHVVGQTCQRSRCPRCYKSWAFRRAKAQVAKLESLRHDREQNESGWQKFHHLTVSFRPDVRVRSKEPVKQLRKITQSLLDSTGVEHGLAVFHNYRIREEYRGEVLGHESGDGDMTWKDVIEKLESDEWPAEAVYSEFLEYAPHFHVLTVSDFVQCGAVTERIAEQTGVVIHRIADDSGTSLKTIDELAAATMYTLSHCALEQRDDSFQARYQAFGRLANHAAPEWALAKADDACRKRSPDVLGLSLAKPECDAPVEPDGGASEGSDAPAEPERAAKFETDGGVVSTVGPDASTELPEGRSSTELPPNTDGWDSGSSTGAGGVRDSVAVQEARAATTPSAGEYERCGTTLRPIRLAREHLECPDVVMKADEDALRNLRKRYEEYKELGSPEPVNDPPPDADAVAPDG